MNILILNKTEFLKKINSNTLTTNFKTSKRNIEHSLGRFIVKLGGYKFFKIDNITIENSEAKPSIKNNLFYFSISHSNDLIGVAFYNQEIGFDIELMKNRNFDKLAKYMNFTATDIDGFYKQWTKFEAEYKSKIKNSQNFQYDNYMCAISAQKINKINLYKITCTYNNIDLNKIDFEKIILKKIIM